MVLSALSSNLPPHRTFIFGVVERSASVLGCLCGVCLPFVGTAPYLKHRKMAETERFLSVPAFAVSARVRFLLHSRLVTSRLSRRLPLPERSGRSVLYFWYRYFLATCWVQTRQPQGVEGACAPTVPRKRHPWDTPQKPQWVTPLSNRLSYAASGVVRFDCFANRDIIQLRLNYSKEGSLAINGIDLPPTDLSSLGEQMKALAEPKRLRILHMLMEGVQCNCELGDALDMAPNLISHHLRVLREAGLVDVERAPDDARWLYYSLNRAALEELNRSFGVFFDPSRIKPRRQMCGPQGAIVSVDSALVSGR